MMQKTYLPYFPLRNVSRVNLHSIQENQSQTTVTHPPTQFIPPTLCPLHKFIISRTCMGPFSSPKYLTLRDVSRVDDLHCMQGEWILDQHNPTTHILICHLQQFCDMKFTE